MKVGDYGGRSLSAQSSTSLVLNPDLPEAFALHTWRQGQGQLQGQSLSSGGRSEGGYTVDSLDRRKPICSIKDEGLGYKEKADFVSFKGSLTFLKHDNDPWYTACPNDGCNKKVLFIYIFTYNVIKYYNYSRFLRVWMDAGAVKNVVKVLRVVCADICSQLIFQTILVKPGFLYLTIW